MSPKTDAPFYRRIVRDSLAIAWRHKHLWIFGFFATMAGYGSVYDILIQAYDRSAELFAPGALSQTPLKLLPGLATVKAIVAFSPSPTLAVLIFATLGALLFAVFAWIATVSIGGLVNNVRRIERGGYPVFADGVKAGAASFWPLFGVTAATNAVIGLAFLLTSANLYALLADRTAVSGAFYVISFTVFTAVAVVASMIGIYAANYVVIKGNAFRKAIEQGWRLLSHHWLVSIEMVLVLLLVSLAAIVMAMIAAAVLSVPVIFFILLASTLKAPGVSMAFIAITGIGLVAAAILLGAFLTTLQGAAWTLLWTELNEKKPAAKIVRLVSRIGSAFAR